MPMYRFEDIAVNCTDKRIPTEADFSSYIGLEHMDTGSIYIKRCGSDVPITGEKLIMHKGDVLLGKRNAYLRRAAIAPFNGLFSAHGMVLQPKKEVMNERFFPLFIASDIFFDVAIRISVGSLSPTINWKDLKDIEFNIPEKADQEKLADVLWAIEDAKQDQEKLLHLTDELVKSQFIEMFGADEQYKVPLGDLCSVITKGTTPTTLGYEFEKQGVNFVKIENITDAHEILTYNLMHISNECNEKMARSKLQEGDILFSIAGAIGRIAIVSADILPANTNQALAIIRLKNGINVNRTFLLCALVSPYVKKQYNELKQGIAQINLSLKNIADLIIPIPTVERQKEFEVLVQQTDKSKIEIKQSIENLKKLEKKIINDALS